MTWRLALTTSATLTLRRREGGQFPPGVSNMARKRTSTAPTSSRAAAPLTAAQVDEIFTAVRGALTAAYNLAAPRLPEHLHAGERQRLYYALGGRFAADNPSAAITQNAFEHLRGEFKNAFDGLSAVWPGDDHKLVRSPHVVNWAGLAATSAPTWVYDWCKRIDHVLTDKDLKHGWTAVMSVLRLLELPPLTEVEAALEVARRNVLSMPRPPAESPSEGSATPPSLPPDENWRARVEAVADENAVAIIRIAEDVSRTTEERMRDIYTIDNRAVGWDSPKWGKVLRVTDAAVRKTNWWKIERPRLRG